MRTVLKDYEPVFGGIVAAIAAAVLCFGVSMPWRAGSFGPKIYLVVQGAAGMSWGLLQIVGYRAAKRKGLMLEEPALDLALGCIFIGLTLAVVTVCLFLIARSIWYSLAAGSASVLLLAFGTIAGIRKGTWK